MADNVPITAGTGTSIAADDIASVWYQRVKLALGADGTAVDAVAGSGVVGTGVQRVVLATDVALPAGANIIGAVTVSGSVATTGPVTDAQLRATAVPVSGSVTTTNAGTFAVQESGTSLTRLTAIAKSTEGDYETVSASQTNQVLGVTGAVGDYISHILVVPATTSPGAVTLLDNATSITVFTGGASSATNLVPFIIPLNMVSVSGSWRITTGANVSCIGVGSFT